MAAEELPVHIAMSAEELPVHSAEELPVPDSPPSACSTNSCLRALTQDTQQVFRIPHRTVLDSLLAHLGLSQAQYDRVVHEDGTIHAVSTVPNACDMT